MSKLSLSSVFKSPSGFQLPVIGLGTWDNKGSALEAGVNSALEAGYRLIDTAFSYGNEDVIGKVLKQWISSGKIKRQDVFITTKLPFQANHPEHIKEYLLKSLNNLQVEYVDLFLIHHPVGCVHAEVKRKSDGGYDFSNLQLDMTTDHVAMWKEMERCVDAGYAKAIGLSNFNTRQIERVLKNSRIPPANLQIEMYLYNQGKNMQEFCKKNGMTLTSYSTLGSPGAAAGHFLNGKVAPLQDPVVVRIAEAHGKSPAQVLLRHMIQCGVAVIPKSLNPGRLRQNIEIFDFELTQSEMEELNGLDRGEKGRMFAIQFMKPHPEFPFPK